MNRQQAQQMAARSAACPECGRRIRKSNLYRHTDSPACRARRDQSTDDARKG